NKYVEVSFGSPNAPPVQDGENISSIPPLEMADLLKKTNDVLDTTKVTMANVQEISSKINNGEGTVGGLVNDKQFYQNLSDATTQAKPAATAFQENMEALKTNFFLRGFFNRRGFPDSTKLAENEIEKLPQGQVLKTLQYDPRKLFEKADTAKLKNSKM